MTISKLRNKVLIFTTLFLASAIISNLSGQDCNFACNDTINVSVDRNCQAIITSDMVLEGPNAGCSSANVTVFDQNNRAIGRVLTRRYIGQYLKVEISDNSYSCWAYIKLEDKLPPEIVCPPNDTIRCDANDYAATNLSLENHLESLLESSLIDNCDNEEITVEITKNELAQGCTSPYSAIRSIDFIAHDNQANQTACSFDIYYEAVPATDIDDPKSYTESMALSCSDNFPFVDGRPYPTVEYLLDKDGGKSIPNINGVALAELIDGIFVTDNLCNFMISYSDQEFESCGGTYKIVRSWLVQDWCNNNPPQTYYQVIKVVDNQLIITDVPNNTSLNADATNCEARTTLDKPTISSTECSNWTWSYSVQEPGATDFVLIRSNISSNTNSVSHSFSLGTTTVRYSVVDECGNMDEEDFRITVNDDDEPMAVCDQRTVVTLNNWYKAKVYARSFDDGSFDACSDLTYSIRRMDGGCETATTFGDYVNFCCEDLGKSIMIELRVTDATGLFSSCMAEAVIQYKGELLDITCRPDPPIMDCRQFDDFNPNSLTPPTITTVNQCLGTFTPIPTVTDENIDDCGNGYKNVSWTISFNDQDSVICTQAVNFENITPFQESDINWPANRTVFSCEDLIPQDSEIEDLLGGNSTLCSNVIYSEPQDRIFDNLRESCVKVLRTWTVVDWCQYPINPNAIWTHVQTIIVKESEAPKFAHSTAIVDITNDANDCVANIHISPLASDDCTSDADLIWSQSLELLSGSSSIYLIDNVAQKDIVMTLDFGEYRASWTVEDHCGNITTASKEFSISDNVAPTVICRNGREFDINPSTEEVIVSVEDIDNNSSDNCSNVLSIGIRRAGTNDILQESLTFSCDDLGDLSIEMVIEDDFGNADNCITIVEIRDPSGICEPGFINLGTPCGYVMDFDGDDDYISIPNLDVTSEFTIEAMVFLSNNSQSFIPLFEFGNDNPFIGFNEGKANIFGQIIDNSEFPVNTWTHLALTYSPANNQSAIYINGELSKSGAATSSFLGEGFGIAHNIGDGFFDGKLDEVIIWNKARTHNEILSTLNNVLNGDESGLVAYYDFNAVAAVLIDKGPNGLTGTLNGLQGTNALPQYEEINTPCPPDNTGASAAALISGSVYTAENISIEKANMSVMTKATSEMKYDFTDIKGDYAFSEMQAYSQYELSVKKNDDYTNGVTTLDLILIQMHILGLRSLDTPYKHIAADANNNQSISSIDLVLLRQLILGVIDELPDNDSWRFIDKNYDFDNNDLTPWKFDETIELSVSDQNALYNDFIGIKIGDVNASATANSAFAGSRSSESKNLDIVRTYSEGKWIIDFQLSDKMKLTGLQLNLDFGIDELENVQIENGIIGLTAEDYVIVDNTLRISWVSVEPTLIPDNQSIFSVTIPGGHQDVPAITDRSRSTLKNEIYDEALGSYGLSFNIIDGQSDNDDLIVMQNRPNPFSEYTDIYFELGQESQVFIEIYSVNGQRIYEHSGKYLKGLNRLNINRNQTGLNKGIYYYQIKTENRSLVRKMIVI